MCWDCHAKYIREWRSKHPPTREQRFRNNARRYVNVYISRGKVKRGFCEVLGCGSSNTQPHHEDYSKPLDVRWFCREHHLAHEGKKMRKSDIRKDA